tara:strand:- start:1166 stop:1543 length:378 start_codon:yes stop_codon:yes gene_type:complete
VITGPLKKRNKLLVFCWIFLFASCTNQNEIVGAKWSGDSDFMFVQENQMRMHYATEITGKRAFIGGSYEVLKSQTSVVIDRLEVTQIDFETREDGVKYCRLWGTVTNSLEECYLLAYECEPIYSD